MIFDFSFFFIKLEVERGREDMRRGHNKKQGLMKTNTWMKMRPGGGEVKLKREIGGEGSPTHF